MLLFVSLLHPDTGLGTSGAGAGQTPSSWVVLVPRNLGDQGLQCAVSRISLYPSGSSERQKLERTE